MLYGCEWVLAFPNVHPKCCSKIKRSLGKFVWCVLWN